MHILSRREMLLLSVSPIAIAIAPSIALSEAITFAAVASFVALALAQGAIAYVGGKVMSSILGDPTIDDIRGWIEAAVVEIEKYFREELKRQLDAKTVEEITSYVEGVNTNLLEYSLLKDENRKKNRFLIEYADLATARLVPQSLRYPEIVFVSLGAMAYRLMSVYSLFLLDRDIGHILANKSMMDNFVQLIGEYRKKLEWATGVAGRIGGFICDVIGGGEEETGGFGRCSLFLDGKLQKQTTGPTMEKASDAMMPFYDALSQKVLVEQRDVLRKIDEPLNELIRCFDEMMRKASSSYSAPSPLSSL